MKSLAKVIILCAFLGTSQASLTVVSGILDLEGVTVSGVNYVGGSLLLNLSDGRALSGNVGLYEGSGVCACPLHLLSFTTVNQGSIDKPGDFGGNFDDAGNFNGFVAEGPLQAGTGGASTFEYFTGKAVAENYALPPTPPYQNVEQVVVRFLTPDGTPTPEPASYGMVLTAGVAFFMQRKRAQTAPMIESTAGRQLARGRGRVKGQSFRVR